MDSTIDNEIAETPLACVQCYRMGNIRKLRLFPVDGASGRAPAENVTSRIHCLTGYLSHFSQTLSQG